MASKQLMAAILNSGLDNGAAIPIDPVSGNNIIMAAQDALADGTDRKNIIRLMGMLGDYNESGDLIAIVDNDGAIIPPADPNGVRAYMDITVVDCP